MKKIYQKQYKSTDGCIYDTAQEARHADKRDKIERFQKKCKHLKTRTFHETTTICHGYEMYERGVPYDRVMCLVCKKDDIN